MSLQKAKSLFVELVANVPPEQWEARLAELAGDDVEMRQTVNQLLAAHRGAASFLESPAHSLGRTVGAGVSEGPGTMIGPYKLLEQIGEGGFGVVFMAEQTEPVRRKVALKILKPGMDTRQVIARFEAERQALAIMDHPNIAKVFDGGATAFGRPYFVMELVKGVPITEFCDQNQLTPRQRLELFIPVCQAVQHAHQKGIVHRDLKPSNVLVTMHDTVPVVKVIDFGVAKALGQELTDKTLFTGFAQMIGSPLYMSPEQAGQSGLDIDTRSDIYALGVLLYELLTGSTPFTKEQFHTAAYDEIRRIIREEEPPKPSTRLAQSSVTMPAISTRRQMEPEKLTKILRGELDWIVMKALEKDRNRRYETANGLALDVQRYLADEPLEACPPSVSYRMRKFVRRNKKAVLALTAIFLLLIAGITGTTWGLVHAEYSRQAETRQRILAEAAAVAERQALLAERKAKEAEAEQRNRATEAAQKATREAAVAAAINNFLDRDILQLASPEGQVAGGVSPDPNLSLRAVLQRAAKQIDGKFPSEPEIEMRLRYTIGYALSRIGDHAGALAQFEEVAEFSRRLLGPDHAYTLNAEYRLAVMHRHLGHFDVALPLLEDNVKRHQAVLGEGHRQTLIAMNGLSVTYGSAKQPEKSLQLAEQTLELRKRHLGPTDGDTLVSMNNVASLYLEQQRLDKAVPLYEAALASMQTRFNPLHPERLNTTANLARAYYLAEELDKAAPLLESVLPQYRTAFGADDTRTLSVFNSLLSCYVDAGWCDKAEALLNSTKSGGTNRRTNANSGQDQSEKRYRELIQRVRPAAEKYQQALAATNTDDPATLAARQALAVALRDQKRTTGAAYHLKAVLDARQRLLGADHTETLSCRLELGATRLQQKRYAEAEPLLLEAYAGLKQPENKSRATETLQRLVQLYDGWEKKDQADQWRKKLEEQRTENNIQGTPVFADP